MANEDNLIMERFRHARETLQMKVLTELICEVESTLEETQAPNISLMSFGLGFDMPNLRACVSLSLLVPSWLSQASLNQLQERLTQHSLLNPHTVQFEINIRDEGFVPERIISLTIQNNNYSLLSTVFEPRECGIDVKDNGDHLLLNMSYNSVHPGPVVDQIRMEGDECVFPMEFLYVQPGAAITMCASLRTVRVPRAQKYRFVVRQIKN
eukprot:TRINITY_DN5292_c0_g1_i2.p1 TRINITY_DN5292_c0_g1~~TRINITY_DN5292_c0_g1_i2.p1  ORF type:complete len:210 (-),score=25.04 TRINITY_DN5292_c0_g1_i2:51-680(-)